MEDLLRRAKMTDRELAADFLKEILSLPTAKSLATLLVNNRMNKDLTNWLLTGEYKTGIIGKQIILTNILKDSRAVIEWLIEEIVENATNEQLKLVEQDINEVLSNRSDYKDLVSKAKLGKLLFELMDNYTMTSVDDGYEYPFKAILEGRYHTGSERDWLTYFLQDRKGAEGEIVSRLNEFSKEYTVDVLEKILESMSDQEEFGKFFNKLKTLPIDEKLQYLLTIISKYGKSDQLQSIFDYFQIKPEAPTPPNLI